MSRIGKAGIKLNNTKIEEKNGFYEVTGAKGTIKVPAYGDFKINTKDGELFVEVVKTGTKTNALWGLTRSLLQNAVKGVETGFEKRLEMIGVGYRSNVTGRTLVLNVGYSHPVNFDIPQGIDIAVEENTKIVVKGIDKILVGQVAANIKKIRKPEPYKGKGIKYAGEVIRRKAGKSGKGA